MFFLSCLSSRQLSSEETDRFQHLISPVLTEQAAYHFYQQFKMIKDPLCLSLYEKRHPEILRVVDAWLKEEKSKIYTLPQFYTKVIDIRVNESTNPVWTWISEPVSGKCTPELDREVFQMHQKADTGLCLAEDHTAMDKIIPYERETMHDKADVVISEEALLCFLMSSTDASDRSFALPVEIEVQDDRKKFRFGEPLPKRELDLRQKNNLFFTQALTRRCRRAKEHPNTCVCTSEWKFGEYSILVQRREQLRTTHSSASHSIPVKIFAKLEYISDIYPGQTETRYEVFTSEELSGYWLALFLRRNAEIYIAHVEPREGKVLKVTTFVTCEDVLRVLPSFIQFKPASMRCMLNAVLHDLQDQPAGMYILMHPSSGDSLYCLRAMDEGADKTDNNPTTDAALVNRKSDGFVDLYKEHEESGKTSLSRIPYVPQEWKFVSYPTQSLRIPHTFPFPPHPKH